MSSAYVFNVHANTGSNSLLAAASLIKSVPGHHVQSERELALKMIKTLFEKSLKSNGNEPFSLAQNDVSLNLTDFVFLSSKCNTDLCAHFKDLSSSEIEEKLKNDPLAIKPVFDSFLNNSVNNQAIKTYMNDFVQTMLSLFSLPDELSGALRTFEKSQAQLFSAWQDNAFTQGWVSLSHFDNGVPLITVEALADIPINENIKIEVSYQYTHAFSFSTERRCYFKNFLGVEGVMKNLDGIEEVMTDQNGITETIPVNQFLKQKGTLVSGDQLRIQTRVIVQTDQYKEVSFECELHLFSKDNFIFQSLPADTFYVHIPQNDSVQKHYLTSKNLQPLDVVRNAYASKAVRFYDGPIHS